MLAKDLINNNIPRLQLQDSIAKALGLMNDFRISHLPVVSDDKFLGLIAEDDLLDAEEEKSPIEFLQNSFIKASVQSNTHFLNAVSSSIVADLTIVPVITNEDDFVGVITVPDLLKMLGNFSGANEVGGLIVLEMERPHFSISEISRIVESNDCTVLHLNTTMDAVTGLLTVTLHINKRELAAVVATFERYEYNVVHYFGTENFENEISSNYRNLMNYLDI